MTIDNYIETKGARGANRRVRDQADYVRDYTCPKYGAVPWLASTGEEGTSIVKCRARIKIDMKGFAGPEGEALFLNVKRKAPRLLNIGALRHEWWQSSECRVEGA